MFRSSPNVHTTDVVQAAEILSRTYIPTTLTATGNGHVNLRLNAMQLPGLTAGIVHLGADAVTEAEEVAHYFVNVPLSGWAVNRWRDGNCTTTTVGSAAVFSPGTPAGITWSGDCGQLCMMVACDEMQRQLEALLNRPVRSPLRFARRFDLGTPKASHWFGLVRILAGEAGRDDGILGHRLAVVNLQQLLIQGLLLIQPHNYTDTLIAPAPAAGAKVVSDAIDSLRANPEIAWTTAILADEVGVSARALQRAFQESGLSPPMTYLRRLRLHRVRGELVRGCGARSVAVIANRWGFVHMGRFAEQYRQVFGESPSETLRSHSATL